METKQRSLVKTITWRIIALLCTSTIVYIAVGSLSIAAEIGFIDLAIKSVAYFYHERAWIKVKWGNLKS